MLESIIYTLLCLIFLFGGGGGGEGCKTGYLKWEEGNT